MQQTTDTILMVRPANFGFNAETAANNAFQNNDGTLSPQQIKEKAIQEFDGFVDKLRNAGLRILVVDETETPIRPDSVFPNNWVSFHEDGTIITYPMFAQARRIERVEAYIDQIRASFRFDKRIHLEDWEKKDVFLEGTGSMVLDRAHHIAYACLSARTDEPLLDIFCKELGYAKAAFHAVDANGQEIYHTNVMMALGETFVVICMESIASASERQRLLDLFQKTGKQVIAISLAQMNAFAGNMLQVHGADGNRWLVMSEQAYRSLDKAQLDALNEHTGLLHSPLYTIETYGGGSARCMMAEVFHP
jgi:hypothetical protein